MHANYAFFTSSARNERMQAWALLPARMFLNWRTTRWISLQSDISLHGGGGGWSGYS
jgi:hypothetical protein